MGEIPEEDEVSSIFKLLIFVTDAPGANVIRLFTPVCTNVCNKLKCIYVVSLSSLV